MNHQHYHENPDILHIGTMENRAYYLPFANRKEAESGISSSRILYLNGDWAFRYYNSYAEVSDDVILPSYDTSAFDKIPVPSVWQTQGYDRHMYTNIKYPFPFDPPYVMDQNPCGLYIKNFNIAEKDSRRFYLNFEGVDSCFYLYIGGRFVGYSQVSHSTSEFDITDYVVEGENYVTVLVLKWCDGSYLEDQDKLRMSGIFRDVYILARPKVHIRDYFVHTEISAEGGAIRIDLEYLDHSCMVEATLYAPDGKELGKKAVWGENIEFRVAEPQLWNAESPALYTLYLDTADETIVQKVGIREVCVRDGVLLLNNTPIRFNGVNRHDSDPVTGSVISRVQVLQDIALMKQFNFNAIRTSHYPNAPWVPQLCDEYGFYLIDEADIESHGCTTIYGGSQKDTFGLLVQNPIYEQSIMDRIQRCVIRDKNCASVLIWSMGNESGYSTAFEKAGRWVKEYDPSRLLHYESSIWETGGHKNDTSMLDFYSRMYASLDEIEEYFSRNPAKPFVQCEYIHAMGNGPGDAEDYYELMEKYPGFCGGFVWEWCDHSVYMGKTVTGRKKYYYGGDFGEFPNDGNFCMDGLVYPDRTPHPAIYEIKNVNRPVRAKLISDNEVAFTNKLAFTCTDGCIDAEYEMTQDGEVIQKGALSLKIAPRETQNIGLPITVPNSGRCYLNIYYRLTKVLPFRQIGHLLGHDQLLLRESAISDVTAETSSNCDFTENKTEIVVSSAKFRYVFKKNAGVFSSMVCDNRNLLEKPMEYNIWRAPIDNDRNIRTEWEKAGYDRHTVKVYSTNVQRIADCVEIKCTLSIAAIHIQRILDICATWRVYGSGMVGVELQCRRNTDMPMLPRFGIRLYLPGAVENVEYLGYGPFESYIDKHRASLWGKYTTTVSGLHEDYVKPQENGSHWGCHNLKLYGSNYPLLTVAARKVPFSFNASHYSQEEMTKKGHNFELEPSSYTILCIDYKQNGIGSNSCGPELLPKYRFVDSDFSFGFSMLFN